MKNRLYSRIICCWLAALVLFSSTGFGMAEHWCQMRGHTKTLLIAQQPCSEPCQADKATVPVSETPGIKKAPCCKTSLTYEHLDVSRCVVKQQSVSTPQPATLLSHTPLYVLLGAFLPHASTEFLRSVGSSSFHRTGRFRLISLCTWLI